MNAIDIVRRHAVNNAWSNLRLHRACAQLSHEEYRATRVSFFPSIPRTLSHILIVDWYYLDALVNGGRGRGCFENEVPFGADLTALTEAQRAADQRLIAFTEGLRNEADLAIEVRMERSDHVQVDSVGNVLLHLDAHQIHHRGQVHAMLAGTHVAPPPLDEFFMRGDLPLRRDELIDLGLPVQ